MPRSTGWVTGAGYPSSGVERAETPAFSLDAPYRVRVRARMQGVVGLLALALTVPANVAVAAPAHTTDAVSVLSGRIVDSSGRPLAGVSISVGGTGVSGTDTSDESGLFEVSTPVGVYVLRVDTPSPSPPGQAALSFSTPMSAPSSDRDLGDLRLPDIPTTRLRLVDSTDVPVFGAWVGSTHDIDLMEPELAWNGAGVELAPGLPVTRATYRLSVTSGSGGDVSMPMPMPRRRDGGLLALPVAYQHSEVESGGATTTTSGALLQSDGAFLLRMDQLHRPVPAAPTDVRAEALDGVVRLTWVRPADTGAPVTIDSYVVTAQDSGERVRVNGDVLWARVVAANGVPRSYTVRARSPFGLGPESVASLPVTPSPTTVAVLSGPKEGQVVLESAVWRLAPSRQTLSPLCRGDRLSLRVSCPSFERVRVSGLVGGDNQVFVDGWTTSGTPVGWARTVVSPTPMSSSTRRRGWRSTDESIVGRRGARLDVVGDASRRFHLFARTGRGQGVIQLVSSGRVLFRIDLGRRRTADLGHVAVRVPGDASRQRIRVRVVSTDPVELHSYAFAR